MGALFAITGFALLPAALWCGWLLGRSHERKQKPKPTPAPWVEPNLSDTEDTELAIALSRFSEWGLGRDAAAWMHEAARRLIAYSVQSSTEPTDAEGHIRNSNGGPNPPPPSGEEGA